MLVHSAVFWQHCYLFYYNALRTTLLLTLKIIKEAMSTLHVVKGILWACSPGSRLDGHPDISAIVESQFSGIYAKAGNPFLDISAVAGPQFSLQASNVPAPKSNMCPPPPPQTYISGSLTHNASPAARVFLNGKVNTQWHLKITTYSSDSWKRRTVFYSILRSIELSQVDVKCSGLVIKNWFYKAVLWHLFNIKNPTWVKTKSITWVM